MAFFAQPQLKRLALMAGVPAIIWFAISVGRGVEPDDRKVISKQVEPDESSSEQVHAGPFRYIGTTSCAASNCHGGARRPEGAQFASYVTWWHKDHAHKGAYEALKNAESKRISKNLYRNQKEPHLPAYKNKACLVCHAVNAGNDGGTNQAMLAIEHLPHHEQNPVITEITRFNIADGIQCEACHGPAERWVSLHTTDAWLNPNHPEHWSSERKFKETGFRNTKGLYNRARMCAECHIGSVGRDMNHDMIAAGHPRLDFEFATFHSQMPSHWDTRKDQTAITNLGRNAEQFELDAQFEARAWMLGQLASADVALELLEYRARDTSPTWPEFSEYSCFACHHDLKHPSWRTTNRRSNGKYPWGTWYFSMLPALAKTPQLSLLSDALQPIQHLTATMGKPYPNLKNVRAQSNQLRHQLRQIASDFERHIDGRDGHRTFTQQELNQLLSTMISEADKVHEHDWEYAAQLYLSIVALHYGYPDLKSNSTNQDEPYKTLSEIRQTLLFPAKQDDKHVDSPIDWRTRSRDLKVWDKLRTQLATP